MTVLPPPCTSPPTPSSKTDPTPTSKVHHILLLPLHILRTLYTALISLLTTLTSLHLPPIIPHSSTKEHLPYLSLPSPPTPASTPTGLLSPSLGSLPGLPFFHPYSSQAKEDPKGRGRGRERQPLTLHVPPSYKTLAKDGSGARSPRGILKVRTPSEWSEPSPALTPSGSDGSREGLSPQLGEVEGADSLPRGEESGERKRAGKAAHIEVPIPIPHDRDREGGAERGERDERVIRFDSVPEVWWIERAERRRSISQTRHPKEEPSIWESWFAGMVVPNPAREAAFGTRMRYDQMVC